MTEQEKNIKNLFQQDIKAAEPTADFSEKVMQRIALEEQKQLTPLIPRRALFLSLIALVAIVGLCLIFITDTKVNPPITQRALSDLEHISSLFMAGVSSIIFYLILDRILRKRKGLA